MDSACQNTLKTTLIFTKLLLYERFGTNFKLFSPFYCCSSKLKTLCITENRTRDFPSSVVEWLLPMREPGTSRMGSSHSTTELCFHIINYVKLCKSLIMCDSQCDRTSAHFPRPCYKYIDVHVYVDIHVYMYILICMPTCIYLFIYIITFAIDLHLMNTGLYLEGSDLSFMLASTPLAHSSFPVF